MAGDWIKMRGNLWDDPRVGSLADTTDTKEATVIGGLYWLWATADQHTEDGILPGLSLRRIDSKTGISGFGAALVAIGWIREVDGGIRIERFEEHNGASAKKRAVTAKRVSTHRSGNADVTPPALPNDDECVTGALAREREEIEEEKRRERGHSDADASGAAAPQAVDGMTSAESRKAAAWRGAKSLLHAHGMPKAQTGAFIGKLASDHPDTYLAVLEAAVLERPAEPDAWMRGACQQRAGTRQPAEPQWRTEQRERTRQAAPGVAAGAPASQFFIDVDAKPVMPAALTRSVQ